MILFIKLKGGWGRDWRQLIFWHNIQERTYSRLNASHIFLPVEIVKENEHIWDECMQKLEDSEKDETRRDIAEAFRVFDRNKDGYLCKKDITMMMHNIGEERMSEKDIKEFMACGDRDGDGLIDFKGNYS